ncbi:MAG TPA: PA14 domain-containing protein [Candidatus Dormibacteraeota bacterium]|nr:PA14 domain-containing protein [Candidatus Dormibacteraeota bacterium]
MKKTNRSLSLSAACLLKLCCAFVIVAFGVSSALADVVYVTSMPQGCTSTSASGPCLPPNSNGTYTEVSVTLGNTGIKGSAPGRPVTPNFSRYYASSISLTSTASGVDVKPVLGIPTWVYQIDYNWNGTAGNSTTNAILSMTATGGTLSTNSTPLMQRGFSDNATKAASWLFMGYITNTVAQPTISFRYQSGEANAGSGNRLLFDCWRFTAVAPCLSVGTVQVTGPLATNVANVQVTGVSSTATNVTVYQNAGTGFTNVGSLAVSSPGNTVAVPVAAGKLVKGAQVGATQWIGGQEGCTPTAGTIVGGGANPRIRMVASIRQPGGLTGPIGVNGNGPSATIYWIKATGGSTTAGPTGGQVLTPSPCWQTVVFSPSDPRAVWNAGAVTLPDPNQFGILEGLSFAMDDTTDTGPVKIYIDNIRNGSTMIQDFENETNGTPTVQFAIPGNSGTTSGNMIGAPNSSAIAQDNAASGTNSALIQWQWASQSAANWIRLNALASGGNVPTPNPEVDLTLPIAVDVLVLPVNQSSGHSLGLITPLEDQTNCPGDNVTFTANATPTTGTGAYTYQWARNGVNIPGATSSSFTTNTVKGTTAGKFSVNINDGTCGVNLTNTLTVQQVADINPPPVDTVANLGDPTSMAVGANMNACSGTLFYQWRHAGTNVPGGTEASLGIPNAQLTDAGVYDVIVANAYDSVTSAPAKLYVVDGANQIVGSGSGLLGLYYSNHLSTAPFTGTAAWTNTDGQVNFDWGTGAPDQFFNSPSLVNTDHFTVRWYGQLQPGWAQPYTFYTTNDDGIRLWVNGQLVIDSWVNQSASGHSGSINLGTNTVPIIVEYFENTSSAVAKLAWDSLSQSKDFIAQSQLYPAVTFDLPTVAMTSPTNSSSWNSGTGVPFSATVVTNSAVINKVQFYRGTSTLIGEALTPPYNYTWANPAAGNYSVFARVVYDISSSADTAAVNISVVNPQPAFMFTPAYSGANVHLSGTGAVGQTFVLQQATNLTAPVNWNSVATNSAGSGSFRFDINPSPYPASFFRVQSR